MVDSLPIGGNLFVQEAVDVFLRREDCREGGRFFVGADQAALWYYYRMLRSG